MTVQFDDKYLMIKDNELFILNKDFKITQNLYEKLMIPNNPLDSFIVNDNTIAVVYNDQVLVLNANTYSYEFLIENDENKEIIFKKISSNLFILIHNQVKTYYNSSLEIIETEHIASDIKDILVTKRSPVYIKQKAKDKIEIFENEENTYRIFHQHGVLLIVNEFELSSPVSYRPFIFEKIKKINSNSFYCWDETYNNSYMLTIDSNMELKMGKKRAGFHKIALLNDKIYYKHNNEIYINQYIDGDLKTMVKYPYINNCHIFELPRRRKIELTAVNDSLKNSFLLLHRYLIMIIVKFI